MLLLRHLLLALLWKKKQKIKHNRQLISHRWWPPKQPTISPKSRELHKTNLIINSIEIRSTNTGYSIYYRNSFVWLLLLLQWVAWCGLLLLWVTIPYNNSISIRSNLGCEKNCNKQQGYSSIISSLFYNDTAIFGRQMMIKLVICMYLIVSLAMSNHGFIFYSIGQVREQLPFFSL